MARLEKTQRKLREAKYFLRLLTDKAMRIVGDREEVLFLASAFMNAAQSVDYVATQEVDDIPPAYESRWFETLATEDQDHFRAMREQRGIEIHQAGTPLAIYTEMTSSLDCSLSSDTCSVQSAGPPGTPAPTLGKPVYLFKDLPNIPDAVEACARYYRLLESYVTSLATE